MAEGGRSLGRTHRLNRICAAAFAIRGLLR